jgi:isoleucyl-tRNA synthetase
MGVFEKVSTDLDFPKEEKEILAFWKERRIFQKSLELRKNGEPFVFYEGPPTANGLPHNGHVLTRVIKDLFPRYQTMRGKFVGRKAGWDTHGLPVETEVEKELKIHGKAAIEAYGVEPFIQKCIDSVFRYTKEWEELTERIGFWVDLDDAYVTYHKSYVESVWWALSQLFAKGLLYQGHKVVWWWAQGGTALSAAEVGQGYRTVDDPSVYVSFPLIDSDQALLVWTTTPWTLSSNSYAAVRADFDYVLCDVHGKKTWLAEGLRDALSKKLKSDCTVLETKKGKDLVGLKYAPPFDLFAEHAKEYFRVVAAEFVTLDAGTGIVHIAPAFGEDDFEVYKREKPSLLLCAVKPDGTFIDAMGPKYAGRWVKEADKDLVHTLKERGVLVHSETYRHEYPFCVRADQDPLIQYARPAWYIRTTEVISSAIASSSAVKWLPEHIKEGRMGDFLRNNVDWALSRERWWGTPLNVWKCAQGHMYAPSSTKDILAKNPKAFDHFHEAKKANPKLNEHLIVHKPWIDKVEFPCPECKETMKRVPEVIDCWFDAGCMPFAQWGYPHTGKEIFEKNFPADFISEAIDQTRGWFYSLLMISTLVFPDAEKPNPFETCVVLGHVCDKEGKKESKSKGNYTPPEAVYDKVEMPLRVVGTDAPAGKVLVCMEDYEALDLPPKATGMILRAGGKEMKVDVETKKGLGRRQIVTSGDLGSPVVLADPTQPAPGADAFRWFFYASSPPWSNTRHSLANVRAQQKEFLVKLRNTYAFFVIYANIDGFDPAKDDGEAKTSELDRWILSELHQTVRGVTEDLDGYLVYEATQKLGSLVDALSNWYVRRSRERFWRSGWDPDKRAAYRTLYECLSTLSKLIAPFVPFTAEGMHRNLVRGGSESVHLADWPSADTAKIDPALSSKMSAVRDIVSLGLQVRTAAKLKVRQPLRTAHVVLSKPDAAIEAAAEMMKDELNVLGVHFVPAAQTRDYVEVQLKPNFRSLGQRGLGREAQMLKKRFAELSPETATKLHRDVATLGKVEFQGVELVPDDLEVAFVTKPGFAAAGDRIGVVALETTLDEELKDLGVLRELVNRVQGARKDAKLDFADRIKLGIVGGERVQKVLARYESDLAREVLATEISGAALQDAPPREVEIEGEHVTLYLISIPSRGS